MKNLFFVLALLFSSSSWSDALTNVLEVGIQVSITESDARSCGITKDLIEASIWPVLAGSKIKVGKNFLSGYLYATANIIDLGENCLSSISLEFKKYIATERDVGGFWSKSATGLIEKSSAARMTSIEYESFTKQFITAWLKANNK